MADLPSLTLAVDELDIGKLKTVPTNLSKLFNVVDNDVAKKVYIMNWFKKLALLIQTNKILKKRLTILMKRYLIPAYLFWPTTSID